MTSKTGIDPGAFRGIRALQARRAFTLIELLVAAAIMALVIAAIGGVLAGGLRAWQAARAFLRDEAGVIPGLTAWERDLSGAQHVRHAPFRGAPAEMTVPVPRAGPAADTPGFVRYRFEAGARAVTRRSWTVFGAEPGDEPAEVMIAGVSEAAFAYLDVEGPDRAGDGWMPLWEHPLRLPQAVRISLTLAASGRRLVRTIELPTAAWPADGEAD